MRPVPRPPECASRPRLWRSVAVWVLPALVLWLGLAGWQASGAAAAVKVTPVHGEPASLDLAEMPGEPDVNQATYTLRSEGGSETVTVSGYSLNAIFEAAGADPFVVGYIEIPRPDGGSVLLSRRQAFTPGAFPEGEPVIYSDDRGTHFLRPSSGDGDHNQQDVITIAPGSAISVVARSGTLLQVTVTASTRKTRVNKPVQFEATLERAGAGEQVQFSWTFGDGTTVRNAESRVTHRFKARGSYDVLVGVTTAGDRVGASGRVSVQVGEPVKQGPDRKGGGSNRNVDAPDSGTAEGNQGAADPGSSGSGSGGGSPGPSYYTPPPVSSPPAYSPPPTPAPAPIPQPQPQPKPEPKPKPRPQPTGDQIQGQLLADSSVAAQALEPEPASPEPSDREPVAARTGTSTPEDESGGGGIPGVAIGFGVTFLMLAGGGLLESRGLGRLRW